MIRVRTIWTILGITGTVIAVAALAGWLLGRVVSDRYGWSQWLLWMPTPGALVAALLGLAGATRPAHRNRPRRRRLAAWAVVVAAVTVYFMFIEHRFLRFGGSDEGGLTLLQSSVYPGPRRPREAYVDMIIDVGADLTILSNPLRPRDVQRVARQPGPPVEIATVWPFTAITRLTVLEARPLVAGNDIYVTVFRVDTTAQLGRPITIYAVDLPSDPKRPRHEIARTARRMLEDVEAPPPDLVVGDFNMTRGSASVRTLFPGFTHAFDQAGRGYGATFRRGFPLYHLDHTLLSDALTATDYAVVDLAIGRHLGQQVRLVAAP